MSERKFTREGGDTMRHTGYDELIDRAKAARNSQRNDSNPLVEKEGFLGIDDLDKMRRRKVR